MSLGWLSAAASKRLIIDGPNVLAVVFASHSFSPSAGMPQPHALGGPQWGSRGFQQRGFCSNPVRALRHALAIGLRFAQGLNKRHHVTLSTKCHGTVWRVVVLVLSRAHATSLLESAEFAAHTSNNISYYCGSSDKQRFGALRALCTRCTPSHEVKRPVAVPSSFMRSIVGTTPKFLDHFRPRGDQIFRHGLKEMIVQRGQVFVTVRLQSSIVRSTYIVLAVAFDVGA
jgi:hypothetical protein